jgi:hypothetical protein
VIHGLRPIPTYLPGNRVISAVNRSLARYSEDAYSPKFPENVPANCIGCAESDISVTPPSPIADEKGAYPRNSTALNLLQSEAVRLDANCRSEVQVLEHEAFLIPALIEYVDRRLSRRSEPEDDLALRDVVDALRMNLVQREDLVAENLAIATAVRRRDNVERLTDQSHTISAVVSAELADQAGKLIPDPVQSDLVDDDDDDRTPT